MIMQKKYVNAATKIFKIIIKSNWIMKEWRKFSIDRSKIKYIQKNNTIHTQQCVLNLSLKVRKQILERSCLDHVLKLSLTGGSSSRMFKRKLYQKIQQHNFTIILIFYQTYKLSHCLQLLATQRILLELFFGTLETIQFHVNLVLNYYMSKIISTAYHFLFSCSLAITLR